MTDNSTCVSPDIDHLLCRLIQQGIDHTLILVSNQRQVIAWLGGSERVFGYASDEVVGRDIAMLFTPEDVDKQVPEYEIEVASRDGLADDDRWMLRKDGQRFWATGVLVPLKGDDGQLLAFAKILRNRTDLKAQLESAHRTIASLEAANERKNAFIATLAHELRNPLSSIGNSLALAQATGSESEEFRFARTTIHRQIDHMRRMIDDLLDVARARVGKVKLQTRIVPLADVVAMAVETCRHDIDRHTHTLHVIVPETPILIEADPERLQQVFVNLLQNALKFTRYGGNIWLKANVEGSEAVVKVEDSGIGISSEMLPLIFDLFTQAEFAGPQAGAGLGVGLSVVKDLTALHGGSVQVRSDGLGKGSEFVVRLPLAGPDAQRPNDPRPVTSEETSGGS